MFALAIFCFILAAAAAALCLVLNEREKPESNWDAPIPFKLTREGRAYLDAEDFVAYEDIDQRLGGHDNPYDASC